MGGDERGESVAASTATSEEVGATDLPLSAKVDDVSRAKPKVSQAMRATHGSPADTAANAVSQARNESPESRVSGLS